MATQSVVSLLLDVQHMLNWLIVAGTAILSVRLFASGLSRRYRVFFLYLVYNTFHTAVMIAIGPKADIYEKVWVLTERLGLALFLRAGGPRNICLSA